MFENCGLGSTSSHYKINFRIFYCTFIMSSSDSIEVKFEREASAQLTFVWLLKREPVLLNKSQIPSVKAAKISAMSRLVKGYEKSFGKTVTADQLRKKLNNMKAELKKKVDKNATGNKKIALKPWEEELLKLLGNNGKNPSFNKIPEALSTLRNSKCSTSAYDTSVPTTSSPVQNPSVPREKKDNPKKKLPKLNVGQSTLEPFETEETRKLTTEELQRLVLLEQLHYIREKRQKLKEDGRYVQQPGGQNPGPHK